MRQGQQTYLISVEVEILSEISLKDVVGWLLLPISGLQEKAKKKAVIPEQTSSPLQLAKIFPHWSVAFCE